MRLDHSATPPGGPAPVCVTPGVLLFERHGASMSVSAQSSSSSRWRSLRSNSSSIGRCRAWPRPWRADLGNRTRSGRARIGPHSRRAARPPPARCAPPGQSPREGDLCACHVQLLRGGTRPVATDLPASTHDRRRRRAPPGWPNARATPQAVNDRCGARGSGGRARPCFADTAVMAAGRRCTCLA